MDEIRREATQLSVLDYVPQGMCVINSDMEMVFWNRYLEDVTGMPRDEVLGKGITTLFPSLDQPMYSDRLARIFEDGIPIVFSSHLHDHLFPARLPNGELQIQHTTVTPIPAITGEGSYALFAVEDVTEITNRTRAFRELRDQALEEINERKQVERRLNESIETSSALLNVHSDIALLTDIEGTILALNDPAAVFLGIAIDDAVGNSVSDLLPQETVEGRRCVIEKAIGTGEAVRDTMEYSGIVYECSVCPVLDHEGKVIRLAMYGRDVTEETRSREVQQSHLRFLENIERVDQVIRRTDDYKEMLENALELIMLIFDSDRAWLVCPSDDEITEFEVSMECTRPEYPGALVAGERLPTSDETRQMIGAILASDNPTVFTTGSATPLSDQNVDFGVKSCMAMAIHPRVERPWVLGLHQCSHEREWTDEEQRLFRGIGRRVDDALGSLLTLQNLRRTEACQAIALEASGAGYFEHSADFTSGSVSKRWAEIFGFALDELPPVDQLSQWFISRIHPEDTDRVQKAITDYAAGVTDNYNEEYRIRHKSGEWRILQAAGRAVEHDEKGNITFVVGVYFDITDRRQAETDLRESEKQYRLVTENSSDIVWTIEDESLSYISPSMKTILGYEPKEFKNLSSESAFPPASRSTVLGLLEKRKEMNARDKDLSASVEVEMIHKDGSFIPMELRGNTMRDETGKIMGVVGTMRDIRDRKRAETQKHDLQEKLSKAQKMESLGILAGGVAHDLNNMLGPLVGYPELLLRKLPKDSPHRTQIKRIGKAAQDAADVIQDLLTLARRGRYEMCPTDLNDVIETYLDSPNYSHLKEDRPDVIVTIDLDRTVGTIAGSATHLQKVIMNLVVNAFDAMPDGGNLEISTSQQPLRQLSTGYNKIPEGMYLKLSVKDSGTGIASEDIDKIFEPYYSKKKMGASGSGLGLSVVYGIIKDHDGFYDVLSEPGLGTQIVLYFLISGEDIVSDETEESAVGGVETVLVVDDVQTQREIATEILSSIGYRVEAVSNGHEAVAYLKDNEVDIVILDMIMEPGFDGLDTYREIIKIRPGQKAVIVSGFSSTDRVEQMQRLGAGQYIKKPYSVATLSQAIRSELTEDVAAAR